MSGVSAAVTFETHTGKPVTWRGEVTKGTPGSMVGSAVRKAKRAHRGERWTSLVVVLDKEGDKPAPSKLSPASSEVAK